MLQRNSYGGFEKVAVGGASGMSAQDGGSALGGGAGPRSFPASPMVPAAAPVSATPHPDAPPGLPLSSTDLPLALKDVDALLSAYSTLRGFNFVLRLSPFTFRSMCAELASGVRPCPLRCSCPVVSAAGRSLLPGHRCPFPFRARF